MGVFLNRRLLPTLVRSFFLPQKRECPHVTPDFLDAFQGPCSMVLLCGHSAGCRHISSGKSEEAFFGPWESVSLPPSQRLMALWIGIRLWVRRRFLTLSGEEDCYVRTFVRGKQRLFQCQHVWPGRDSSRSRRWALARKKRKARSVSQNCFWARNTGCHFIGIF